MLKKYMITVEGKTYEVEVEDVSGSSAARTATQVAAPAPAVESVAAPAKAAPAPEAPKAVVAAAPSAVSGEALRAPMPGTILNVSASVGQAVQRGDVLLILEAMKMETESVAPSDATIEGIYVQKGASVNAGDILVSFS